MLEAMELPRNGLIRNAARHNFEFEPKQGMIYVRSRMISSRVNDNWDGFPADEITKGWQTFLGKPVFISHHNENHYRARGVIVDAALHHHKNSDGSPDTWVEGLQEVDALTFPKLAQRILRREIERTSMGVDVDHSVCSACGNKATDTFSYCQHIPGQKGRKFFASGKKGRHIFETCYGLRFFENSLLVEPPADPTAFTLGDPVVGSGLEHLTAGLQRTASRERIHVVRKEPIMEPYNAERWDFDPSRMHKEAARVDPVDHPFFKANPVHPDHIISHWNDATDDEKAQGKRWYPDAHLVAKSIAKLAPIRPGKSEGDKDARHPNGDSHLGAGALAIYSPQQGWAGNMHNAARALHEGHGIGGPGSGIFASKSQSDSMDKVLSGKHYNDVVSGPKIRDFAHLIEHGGDEHPEDHPEHVSHVVIDRHALGVATGKRMSSEDYNAAPVSGGSRRKDGTMNRSAGYDHVVNAYHQAAQHISKQEGEHIPGHAVQAVTWLVQQRKNQEAEAAAKGTDSNNDRLNKGREVSRTNAEKGWDDFRQKHIPDGHAGPGTGYVASRHLAYGETLAPPNIDTLRDENCPICGEDDAYDGKNCPVCGYVAPPSPFNDPDLDMASKINLQQQQQQFDQTQMADPDKMAQGEGDGTLICDNCGTEFPEEQPESVDTDETAPDVATQETEETGGAAEGDVCPACGKGLLESQGDLEAEEGDEGAPGAIPGEEPAEDDDDSSDEDDEGPKWDPKGGDKDADKDSAPDDDDEDDDQPGVAVKSSDGAPKDDDDDSDDDKGPVFKKKSKTKR
jgi:hypothetical protein